MSPEPTLDRTLPHNLDAERSVLGAILLNNAVFLDVQRVLVAEDFYRDAHRRIFQALGAVLDRKGGAADFLLVREELARRGDLEEVGGQVYIASLVDGVPRATNVRHYAGLVKEAARARALIMTLMRSLDEAFTASDPIDDVLQRVDSAILNLRRQTADRGAVSLAKRTNAILAGLEFRVANRGRLLGVDSGFPCLNEMTFGFQPGQLVVVGARPSMGKTALTTNILTAVAAFPLPEGQAGQRVGLMFSMEMEKDQIETRILSSLSRIPSQRILGGALGGSDWDHLTTALDAMHRLAIVIDDTPALTVADLRARCREVLAEHGRLDIVVIDYIQLMTGTLNRRGATRTEELADISKKLKLLARELGVPFIVLSQLKRLAGARPKLEDLRECGNLEQDADVVLFLHRSNHQHEGPTELLVSKNRNGPTGPRMLHFEQAIVRFEDRGQAPPDEATMAAEEKAATTRTRKRSYARRHTGRGMIED